MNDIQFRNVKGTFDYLPKEQKIRNYIADTLRKKFEVFGYKPVETPILCYYDVLASKYGAGAEILKEVYTLSDQGERDLALRYDLTVPLCRLMAMNPNLTLPFKRYEIGRVYRDGPVKVGRNREFMQCDVDAVGIKNMMIEAEQISLAVEVFKEFGIDVFVEYNNRKLMSGLLEIIGIDNSKLKNVITVLDKIKKLTPSKLQKEYETIGLTSEETTKINQYFSLSFEEVKEQFYNVNENVKQGIDELIELDNYLKSLNIYDKMVLNLNLARGHDIYTGTVFEVFAKDKLITSSIAGGGRFDNIITNFINNGNEYPACGISFGLDVIYQYLTLKNSQEKNNSEVELLIIPMNTQTKV